MHASTVLAVLATVASAAVAPAYAPASSISSVEQAATISAPAYGSASSISSVEQAATVSAPAYDPTSSIPSVEASASAPLYPTFNSQNAGFNFTRPASGGVIATTSCTDSTDVPAASGTIVTSPTNVPAASTTIITLEQGTVVTTVYVSSATSQPAAGSAPSYHNTAAPSNSSPVNDPNQSQEQDGQSPAICNAKVETVTVTNTQTITVKQTGDAPSAAPTPDAPAPDAQPIIESPAPSAAPTDDGSELQPSIITLEQSASVELSTEEADATALAYSTEEADATISIISTQGASATLTVLPLAGASNNEPTSYQNASASTTKAYTGSSYEGGASSYGVAGFTLMGALALVLAL